MNVTLVPEQIVVPELLAIATDVEIPGFTVIVMLLLFAVEPVTQLIEEVMVHVITSPLFNVVELNVALFAPTGDPFLNHW